MGVDFGVLGADHPSLSANIISWLRSKQASDWISHPYWMYTRGGSRPKNPGWIHYPDPSRRSIFVPGHSGTVCTYNL